MDSGSSQSMLRASASKVKCFFAASTAATWTQSLLGLGLALRIFHYLREPSLWHDEAAVVVNVLKLSYSQMFGPLLYSEAAPPAFLGLEKAIVEIFGDGLLAFRLFPFLASCAALVVIVRAARRLLVPTAVPWVAAMASTSDTVLWHTCEAKPYAIDLLIACLAKSAFAFGDRRDLVRRLFVAAVLSPLVIFLSFPGVFVLAGLYAAWWWDSRAKRCARTGLGFVVFAAAIGISFLVLWAGPIHAQKDERIVACWANAFPDWSRPWNLPWWLAVATTDVARYSFVPVGNALFGAIVVGGLSLWSADRRSLLVLLLLPVALAAAAGALGHYPFGCYRVMVFAAPACWLMAGAGVAALFQRPDRFSRLAAIALAGLAAFGVAQACYRVIVPWKRAEVGSAVAYVRARIQPTDAVIGNAWEDAYYFRDGAITYVPSETFESLPFDRVWVIATTPNPRLRDAILKKVEAHGRWRVVDRQEFTRVGVYALEREN